MEIYIRLTWRSRVWFWWWKHLSDMEGPGKDEGNKVESHVTSAAAFVEGGIQEACNDACSICLEAFCESDPSSVTSCKHEFHLQCILEWCQRSSNCPMCWQSISLKDPASQELLEAVEQERSFRSNPARNAAIFHHPTLGDFELQHLPVGANDSELEERIIQHLAAAAAMGRSHHIARRGSRSRSSAHGRPEFLVFSTHANAPSSGLGSAPPPPIGAESEPRTLTVDNSSPPLRTTSREPQEHVPRFSSVQSNQLSGSSSGSVPMSANHQGTSNSNRSSSSQPSIGNQDRPGPSEFQSFSESWKSRLNSMSMKYKESIAKSTKGWKERLFSRSTSMSDIGSEVRREVNAGLASVSRMMERLETRDSNRAEREVASNNVVGSSVTERRTNDETEGRNGTSLNSNNSTTIAASSVSS